MKKLLLLFTLFTGIILNAQYVEQEVIVEEKLTVGTSDLPTGNSVFEVGDTLGGVKFPRFTQTQIDNLSLSNADTALMLYNLTDSVYQFYDGDTWGNMQGGATLYSSNGTLSGARTVDHNGNTLTFSNGKAVFSSTDNGIQINEVTTAQMNAISTPVTNELVFNTDLEGLYRYDGANWVALAAGFGIVGVNDANGQPTYYASLRSAVDAISGNGVVTLYSDITIDDTSEEVVIGSGDDLTINGNGYTITHTCNTGDNFSVIFGSGNNLYLNNVKIISNGTASGVITATVIGRSSSTVDNVYCDKTTYIYALNNNIFDQADVYGGSFEAVNGYVAFSGNIYDAKISTYETRGNFYNCKITLTSGGRIGATSTTEIFNCTITGSASTRDLITINNSCQFLNNTVICTGGTFDAVQVNGGTNAHITVQNCTIYNYGTGVGLSGIHLNTVKDTYVFSNGMGFDCVIPGSSVYHEYHVENLTVVTNSANKPAVQYRGTQTYKVKNLIAICSNASNTEEAIEITSTPTIYLEDCTANVNNAAIDNVIFTGSATAYIFGLKMNSTGTGLNLGTATLSNTTGTIDEYGNGQIE